MYEPLEPEEKKGRFRSYFDNLIQRFEFDSAFPRTIQSVLPVLQIVIAAGIAYAIAVYGLHHEAPLLAVTVTLSSLGFVRDARPSRVLETAVGILTGIGLSALFMTWVGKGLWQIAVILFATLLIARFISPSPQFAVVAGVQSMMVAILPEPDGGYLVRFVDGSVGGLVALFATFLLPRDPKTAVLREARQVFDLFQKNLSGLATSLRLVDQAGMIRTTARIAKTDRVVEAWKVTIDSAVSVARFSPFLRRLRVESKQFKTLQQALYSANRNLAVIARRCDYLVSRGKSRTVLADLFLAILEAIMLLSKAALSTQNYALVQQNLTLVALRLHPDHYKELDRNDRTVIMMCRPLLVDLLLASGLSRTEALQRLPQID